MDKAFTRLKKFVVSRRDDEGATLHDVVEYVMQNVSDLALSFGKSEEQLLDAVKAFEDKGVLCKALLGQIESDKCFANLRAEDARRARVQKLADEVSLEQEGTCKVWNLANMGWLVKETGPNDYLSFAIPSSDSPLSFPSKYLKRLLTEKPKNLTWFIDARGLHARWYRKVNGKTCFGGFNFAACGYNPNANYVRVHAPQAKAA